MKKSRLWKFQLLLSLAMTFAALECYGLTVSGTIKDSTGSAVPSVKVRVMNYNPLWPDTEIAVVWTTAAGAYTCTTVSSGKDVYLIVEYISPINTALAPGQYIRVVHNSSSSTLSLSTYSHTGGYIPNIAANGTINRNMDRIPGRGSDSFESFPFCSFDCKGI